jgi:transposase
MDQVIDRGTPLIEDPARLAPSLDDPGHAPVCAVGVDETAFLRATGAHPTLFATGIADLTPGRPARLLDVVEGRSGTVLAGWLAERAQEWKATVATASLDPFRGYASALTTQLPDAVRVLDPFHVVKLGLDGVDQVRRRVQQDTLGHRGHRDDPLYRIRNILRAGAEKLTDRQWARLSTTLDARLEHEEVGLAWSVAQRLRLAYRHPKQAEGRKIAERLINTLPSCPVPELARLGRTLKRWREALLAYLDTDRSSNGGTEAVNGLIELTGASPAAFATATTIDSACSSSRVG